MPDFAIAKSATRSDREQVQLEVNVATVQETLERTRPMMAMAESVDAATPGAAGLAYQAAELAVHVMMMEIDGYDPWDDGKRYRRASEILDIAQTDFAFLRQVRMRDFYANAARVDTESGIGWGPPLESPDDEDCRRCVVTARRVVDAVHTKIAPPSR